MAEIFVVADQAEYFGSERTDCWLVREIQVFRHFLSIVVIVADVGLQLTTQGGSCSIALFVHVRNLV